MKKIFIALILVFALFVSSFYVLNHLNVFDKPNEGELTTTIGCISNVRYVGQNDNKEIDNDSFIIYLYVYPLGQTTNDNWIIFTVSTDTEIESADVNDILKTPALSVGSTVEITHSADIHNQNVDKYVNLMLEGFFVNSIRTVSVDESTLTGQDIQLVLNEDYDPKEVETERYEDKTARIVRVVKVEEPIGGYIIYLHESERSDLLRYWVDEGTRLDEEMAEYLETGHTGALIKYLPKQSHPFMNENEDICGLVYLNLVSP